MTNHSTPALETHDLTVTYHKRPVLYGIDVAVPEGVWSVLLGLMVQANPP